MSYQNMLSMVTNAWGEGASWVLDGGEHPHEAHYLKLDCSKAKSNLDWHPRWHLEETLSAIIDWHRAHRDGKNMRALSLSQIQQYTNS
jgi:CDP-glucose 4,6-dehydratase